MRRKWIFEEITVVLWGFIILLTLTGSALATVKSSVKAGGANVLATVRTDKKALNLDFSGFPANTESVSYSVTYTYRDNGARSGVDGTISPGKSKAKSLRKQLLFGTCSKNVCVLHRCKNVKITVRTKIKGKKGSAYTRTLTVANNKL